MGTKNHGLPSSYPKLLTLQMRVHTLISNIIIFFLGLVLGITLTSYHKDHFPFNIQFNYQINPNITTNNPPKNNDNTTFIISPPKTLPSSQSQSQSRIGLREYLKPPSVWHDMDDEELLWRASMAPRAREFPFYFTPKVAFMFLVRREVSLAPLWDMFFRGHKGLYSVYVHADPSFNRTQVSQDSAFYGRSVPSKAVKWGDANMMEAERRLLANALLDMSNQRFVLLSESCIPLFNFSTVYNYLMASTKNFVEAYDFPGKVGRGRFSQSMKPRITLGQWRKGSQWFAIARNLAVEVTADRKYLPLFQKFCKGYCYTDEHYLPTFVSIRFWKGNSNRTLTWVDWEKGGPHPTTFARADVLFDLLERLRNGSECEYNGKRTRVCHLFARKFLPNALSRLVRFAPKIMHFN